MVIIGIRGLGRLEWGMKISSIWATSEYIRIDRFLLEGLINTDDLKSLVIKIYLINIKTLG